MPGFISTVGFTGLEVRSRGRSKGRLTKRTAAVSASLGFGWSFSNGPELILLEAAQRSNPVLLKESCAQKRLPGFEKICDAVVNSDETSPCARIQAMAERRLA